MKGMKRKDAWENPLYQALYKESLKRLKDLGVAGKEEVFDTVLAKENWHALSKILWPDTRWDYIREWLEKALHCKLIPVSNAFFSEQARHDSPIDLKPEKHIAHGYGKATAGWITPERAEYAPVVVSSLKHRQSLVHGQNHALNEAAHDAHDNGSKELKKVLKVANPILLLPKGKAQQFLQKK
jgi:hypothetical protein